jgi:ABC-type oligopeptide transport system ATPase subunit
VRLDPGQVRHKYPHQLSGGQLQRILIARALLLDVELLVADEIVSMVDASTRIDVLNLLADLKRRGLGVLFVTHDLALGNYLSSTTVILRHGVVVETGATAKVFGDPRQPYTQALLTCVPSCTTGGRRPGSRYRRKSPTGATTMTASRESVRAGPCSSAGSGWRRSNPTTSSPVAARAQGHSQCECVSTMEARCQLDG